MSISDERPATQNPVTKYIQFKNGSFNYWNKEKEAGVNIPLPFKFTVMDELACISGWDETAGKAIYSNEVHSTKNEELKVSSDHILAEGLYQDIKDKVKASGGRFTSSIYAIYNGEVVNIKLKGAALGSWIDKDFKPVGVEVSELEDGKKGATTYKIPIFKSVESDEIELAKEKDKELQKYFINKNDLAPTDTRGQVASAEDFDYVTPKETIEDLPF